MYRRPFPLIASLTMPLLLTVLAVQAHAQPGGSNPQNLAAAQALYDEATKAMDASDYATACPKLEDVVKLVPEGVGARLTLAQCYDVAGKLASAYTNYEVAETMAAEAKQPDRQKEAHDRAEALKPKLARLTINVAEGLRSLGMLQIQCDGVQVGSAEWGMAIPIDKGRHMIVVTASGKRAWEKAIEVSADGVGKTVTIDALVDTNASTAIPLASPSPHVTLEQTTAPPFKASSQDATSTPWGVQGIAGVAVGAVGLAGLGIGGALGVVAIQKKNASNHGHCHDGNQCDNTGIQLRRDGITMGNASTALFVVGGAAVATGVVLFVTASKKTKRVAALGLGPVGAEVRGTW